MYRLLAQALAYPDKHFVVNLQAAVDKIKLELFDDECLPLRGFIRELGVIATLSLDQIQGEYTRLFINAFSHVPCPPYESACREGELMGDAAMQVAEEYRAWGVIVESEKVDHVGVELEFVAFLLTLNAPEAYATASTFCTQHLLRWLPRFADNQKHESHLAFYRMLAELLTAVLRRELNVNELIYMK